MTDHSPLYSIQNDILVAIRKILNNLKVEKACNKTQNYFEKHERDLETLWNDFRTNHEKLKNEGKNKRDLYFRSDMFTVVEGVYKTTRNKLHQMHQYYKLTKFPAEGQGSSQKHEIQEVNEKQEIEEICTDRDNSEIDTEINPVKLLENSDVATISHSADPVKLLENSDVATISHSAVMNIGEETSNGVEFISVELLLNELAQTSKMEDADEQQKSTTTQGNIDLSVLELFDEQPDRKVRCPFKDCNMLVNSKDRMIRHLRIHNGEMPFQCNYCDYATYNSTRIKEHINTHSGVKPYKCSFCNYSSVSKKYLKKHEAKHCQCHCGYVSKNQNKLSIHKQEDCPLEQEKANKYTCQYCKGFSTRVSSRTHRQERGLCSICNDFVCDLSGHMLRIHGTPLEVKASEEVKVKNCKFVCKVCGWKGGREHRVLLHLIHHPQDVSEDIDVTILKKYNIL